MVRKKRLKVDAAMNDRIKAEKIKRVRSRAQLETKRERNRAKRRLLQPKDFNISEQFRTGVLLILIALIDTAFEWHLWAKEGGIIMGILVLSRIALLAYGAQKVWGKGSAW